MVAFDTCIHNGQFRFEGNCTWGTFMSKLVEAVPVSELFSVLAVEPQAQQKN